MELFTIDAVNSEVVSKSSALNTVITPVVEFSWIAVDEGGSAITGTLGSVMVPILVPIEASSLIVNTNLF